MLRFALRTVAFLSLLLLVACNGSSRRFTDSESGTRPDSSMVLSSATGFTVDYFKEYKRIILQDPWKKGSELVRYYLVHDNRIKTPADGVRIRIPVRSMVSGSCTQYEFLDTLGVLQTVTGVCNVKTIYNSLLAKRVATGKAVDLGDPFQIDVERCLMLKPELLLMNSYNQQDEHLNRIRETGIPVLYDNEWMEPDLLARAEWIRFVACFYDKEAQALQIFNDVKKRYQSLEKVVQDSKSKKPSVLSGDDFRGTWYVPGGRSYTARLFADAGAAYCFSADTTSGSNPLTFEQILHHFAGADVWVGVTNGTTLNEIVSLDERYALLKSFRNKRVYSYTLRTNSGGGNDYWESAVAYPDRLLSDFVKAFHPQLLKDRPFYYLRKLN